MQDNKIDLREWVKYNNTFVHRTTGEVLNKSEVERMVSQSIVIESQEQIDLASSMGLSVEISNVSYKNINYSCRAVKQNCEFDKLFRVNWRNMVEESNLSMKAHAMISMLQGYISFPTNLVIINGKPPSYEKLMKKFKMSKTTVYDALKELEDNHVVIRRKIEGKLMIYFNPFLISSGKFVTEETYNMFSELPYM